MILNEMVSNALECAVYNRRHWAIMIDLRVEYAEYVMLRIVDTSVGSPKGIDVSRSSGETTMCATAAQSPLTSTSMRPDSR
jgi:two-component sensor histidine kinase